jgi:hypothetical protein
LIRAVAVNAAMDLLLSGNPTRTELVVSRVTV